MKTVEEFIKQMVKVDYVESSNCYGHYPFQLLAENENGTLDVNGLALGVDELALGVDVASCYRKFKEYKQKKAKRIYMSLDFSSGLDMDNDFVCIFKFEDNEISLSAIPYSEDDGKVFDTINKSSFLDKIKTQFLEEIEY